MFCKNVQKKTGCYFPKQKSSINHHFYWPTINNPRIIKSCLSSPIR